MELVKRAVSEQTAAQNAVGLIGTKLDVPPLKSKMVHREHLLDGLSRSNSSRLVLISGMAGSGKTSLACQWIEKNGPVVAWYGLDENDNDPDLFFHYLLTTLSKADTALGSLFRPLLQSQKGFSGGEIIPLLIDHLTNSPKDIYIILDDYHLIVNPDIHETISHLLSHLPPRLHLVIISRYNLPFSVSQLKVRDQLIEISPEDLKFTREETDKFFAEVMSCRLSIQETDDIFHQTEGWVGGLQLFGLTRKKIGTSPPTTAIRRNINKATADYLIDEVLSVQPEKVRRFLSLTSFLDRFTVETCKEVTGFSDAGEIIDFLHRNHLFLVPLDDEGEWYRYHHLLSEAVRKRVLMQSPGEIDAVHRKAVTWFSQNDCIEDALLHAFATKDFEFAADVLENHLSYFIDRYELLSGRRWLEKLPENIRTGRALLKFFECQLYFESLRVSEAETILSAVEKHRDALFSRYEGDKRMACEDLFVVMQCLLLFSKDPLTADLKKLEEQYLGLSPRNPSMAVIMKILMAVSFFLKGQLKTAFNMLQESSGAILTNGRPFEIITWYCLMATIEDYRGHLRRAEALLEEAEKLLEQRNLSFTPLRFLIMRRYAWIHFNRNNLSEALELAVKSLANAEEVGNQEAVIQGNFLISLINLSQGRIDEAARYVHKMKLAAPPNSGWAEHAEGFQALFAIFRGDIAPAMQLVSRKEAVPNDSFSLFDAYGRILYADFLSFFGRGRDAITCLNNLREQAETAELNGLVLDIDLSSAIILSGLGDIKSAKTAFGKALAFAGQEGYIQPFAARARFFGPALRAVAADLPKIAGSAFLSEVMKACGIYEMKITGQNGPSSLTTREKEVLALMAQGLKNKEIAEQTFVSLDTIKSHVKHIYEKLHVETRIQAIKRAEELRLF